MESIIVPLYYDFLSFQLTDTYQGIISPISACR